MRVQTYLEQSGFITITVATYRVEAAPSTKFTAASIHEDYAAKVRALMKEYRHTNTSASLMYPAAKRLATYLPTHNGEQLFSIRELQPAGAPRDIDEQWQLEIMRIRYAFTVHLLPAAFLADESIAEALERHMTVAVRKLFVANNVHDVFIPGDQGERSGGGTEIDIICECGPASGRGPAEIPTPSQT